MIEDQDTIDQGAGAILVKPVSTSVGRTSPSGRFDQDSYRRMNGYLSIYIVASAALCALPVGMNRPVPWLIWCGLTAAVAALYVVWGHLVDPSRRLISRRFWPMFALGLLIPIWAIMQSALPVSIAFANAPDVAELVQHRISALPSASNLAALRFTVYLLLIFLVLEVAGRKSRAKKMGLWIFWSIVVHAVWALVALNLLGDIHIWGADKSAYQGFATGTFVNRNSFASFLAMGAVLGFTLLQDRLDNPTQRKARTQGLISIEILNAAFMALGVMVIWVALLATASRMGVFAAGIGMFVSFFAMRVKMQASLVRGVLIFVCAAAILGLIGIFGVGQDLAWRSFFVDRDSVGRADVYRAVLAQIAERPLIGYGFDAFRPAFEWSSSQSEGSTIIWDRAHSTYLSHWFELGLIIGSIPMILVGLCFARALQLWKRRNSDYALPVAAFAVIASQAIHSTVDFSLEMPANVVLFLAIVGLGITPRHRKGQRAPEKGASGVEQPILKLQ